MVDRSFRSWRLELVIGQFDKHKHKANTPMALCQGTGVRTEGLDGRVVWLSVADGADSLAVRTVYFLLSHRLALVTNTTKIFFIRAQRLPTKPESKSIGSLIVHRYIDELIEGLRKPSSASEK